MYAILGLGTNVGDRMAHLRKAVHLLALEMPGLQTSGVYESVALLPEDAPQEWDEPFYNMAVAGPYPYSANTLLQLVKSIEASMGRQERGYWGPREIDIDILALGTEVVNSDGLRVPHRDLLKRDFALVPLAEVAPDWACPLPGAYKDMTARELVEVLGMDEHPGLTRIADWSSLAA